MDSKQFSADVVLRKIRVLIIFKLIKLKFIEFIRTGKTIRASLCLSVSPRWHDLKYLFLSFLPDLMSQEEKQTVALLFVNM